MQRPLTMRTSDRSHIDHERPGQRNRYKRKKHRPPESHAEEDEHSRDRQAQHDDLHEKPVPSLNNSKDVQFEIPRHGSRVAVTSPQTDLPGMEELCRTRSFSACKSRSNQRAVGKQNLKSRSRVRKSEGYAVIRQLTWAPPRFPLGSEPLYLAKRHNGILQRLYAGKPQSCCRVVKAAKLSGQH